MTEPVAPPDQHLAELSAEIVAGYVKRRVLQAKAVAPLEHRPASR